MPAWLEASGRRTPYCSGGREGCVFSLSVNEGSRLGGAAGVGAGEIVIGAGAGREGGVMTMGSGAMVIDSTGVTSDTVTIAAGMAAPREQVARSRTMWRPRQNMSS